MTLYELEKRLIVLEGTVRWMRWLWTTLGSAIIIGLIGALISFVSSYIL